MRAVVKRRFIAAGAAIALAFVVVAFILLRQITNSSALTERITVALSELTGHQVKLTQPATLATIFPRTQVVMPSITLNGEFENVYRLQMRIREARAQVSPFMILNGSYAGLQIDLNELAATLEPLESSKSTTRNTVKQPDFTTIHSIATSLAEDVDIDLNISKTDLVVHQQVGDYGRWNTAAVALGIENGQGRLAIEGITNIDTTDGTTTKDWPDHNAQLNWILHTNQSQTQVMSSLNVSTITNDPETSTTTDFSTQLRIELDVSNDLLSLNQLTLNSPAIKIVFNEEQSMHEAGIDIKGQASVTHMNVAQLLSILSSGKPSNSKARLFDYTPFESGIPPWLHIDLDTSFDTETANESAFFEGSLHSTVKDGNLSINSDTLSIMGGHADVNVTWISQDQFDTRFDARIHATDMALEQIRASDGRTLLLDKGLADLSIGLSGRGPSTGHLAASINGFVHASIDDAVLNKRYTTAVDRGVVSWALERLSVTSRRVTEDSPGARLSDPLAIECASLRIIINDGQATAPNGIVIELLDNTLYASGFLNLHDESLGLAFRTRRKSLFDWSAISIARYLEVSGTLAQADIQLNAQELVRQGVLSASSVAWGPLPAIVYTMAESGLKNRNIRECFKSID